MDDNDMDKCNSPSVKHLELPPVLEARRLISRLQMEHLLLVSRAQFYALQGKGKILAPAGRVGKSPRWKAREVAKWMDAGRPDALKWESMKKEKSSRRAKNDKKEVKTKTP